MRGSSLLLWLAVCLALLCSEAFAQSAANVLVIVNDASPASAKIAAHYMQRRNVPSGQIVHLRTTTTEEILAPNSNARFKPPSAAGWPRIAGRTAFSTWS